MINQTSIKLVERNRNTRKNTQKTSYESWDAFWVDFSYRYCKISTAIASASSRRMLGFFVDELPEMEFSNMNQTQQEIKASHAKNFISAMSNAGRKKCNMCKLEHENSEWFRKRNRRWTCTDLIEGICFWCSIQNPSAFYHSWVSNRTNRKMHHCKPLTEHSQIFDNQIVKHSTRSTRSPILLHEYDLQLVS